MKPQNPPCVRPAFLASCCDVDTTGNSETNAKPAIRVGIKMLSALVGAAVAVGAGTADAVEAKLSGHVNRALMWVDDGTNTELHNVDNNVSSTRFRFTGSGELMPGVKAGIVFENEFESNASNAVTQTAKTQDPTFKERQSNVYFQGGFGKLTLGQTDGAANGGTEVDLSGTSVVQGALATNAVGGAILFRNSTVTGPSIGGTTSNQDFESRYDLLRYDSPALGPVTLAVSTGVNGGQDTREAALWYSGNIAGGKLAAALGFSRQDATVSDDKTTGGSISWLASSGLNVTLATSKRDIPNTTREGKFNYVKLGYMAGQHAFSVDFGKGKDQSASGDDAKVMGVAWVYTPVKWAEIYATLEQHSLDQPGISFDDIQIVMAGSRIKF